MPDPWADHRGLTGAASVGRNFSLPTGHGKIQGCPPCAGGILRNQLPPPKKNQWTARKRFRFSLGRPSWHRTQGNKTRFCVMLTHATQSLIRWPLLRAESFLPEGLARLARLTVAQLDPKNRPPKQRVPSTTHVTHATI